MFSAFSGLAIQAFSRSSNPRSNLCCQRNGFNDGDSLWKKHTLNCTKYRFYHLMKGADRDGCLTPHSEDHCDEDYGNRLAHLILRIMMMFHWTKKLPPHRYVIYVVHHKKCSSGADGDDQKSWWRSI